MNLVSSSLCERCDLEREQTPRHMLYECSNIKVTYKWFLRVLMLVCNFRPTSNIKLLYFDNIFENVQQKNVCNMLIASYIICVWRTRKENLRIGILKKIICKKILSLVDSLIKSPGYPLQKFGGDYISKIDLNGLLNA